ncbi:MAG: hypothetical protein J2P28_21175 [Actinobacteria bacterium]|nr:hypothetical protein [Actinomycetota bacterium]MBO0838007.1 hypothetical protein [Actinomycetota bacterium]
MPLRLSLAHRTRRCERNPLRRRLDDVEVTIMTALVVLFLVVAPLLAILTGRLADAAGLREQRLERSWHPVPAVLEQSAAQGMRDEDAAWGIAWVKAHWYLPSGAERTGSIAVGLNARAGQRVTIWVNRAGQVTHRPLSHGEVLDGIANTVMATVVGVAVVFGLAGAVARMAVNRRRMAAWTRAWEVIGPSWTSLR